MTYLSEKVYSAVNLASQILELITLQPEGITSNVVVISQPWCKEGPANRATTKISFFFIGFGVTIFRCASG